MLSSGDDPGEQVSVQPVWTALEAYYGPAEPERRAADALLTEYEQRGYVHRTPGEMLLLPNDVIARFYAELARTRSTDSPVRHYTDSSWMTEADFCFVNVRATGIDDTLGNFVQASKLLPCVRASAIHLAPFTLYDYGSIYAVLSTLTIAPPLVDQALAANGFEAEAQLRAFIQAAHLLGKAVGYDIEPHTALFSIPVLNHPELFRWIKLDQDDRNRLAFGVSQDEMVTEPYQERISGDVRTLVRAELAARGLVTLEMHDLDDYAEIQRRLEARQEIAGKLQAQGYFTIPAHAWQGRGVPIFDGYDVETAQPRWLYLDREGHDVQEHAHYVITPFKFYHNLPVNRSPAAKPARNQAAIDFYSRITTRWLDEFAFDFVRFDWADHILDSLVGDDFDYPAADRPTPAVFEACIREARAGRPYVGALAERMGWEGEVYRRMGFDVMLGSDMFDRVDRGHLEKTFAINAHLTELNGTPGRPFSVLYTVDTHDTGDPRLLGMPIVYRAGPQGTALRHFIARFASSGPARRPKYEVMGVQDMSFGLHGANVNDANLIWVGDAAHNAVYHRIEDLYERCFRETLSEGYLALHDVTEDYAWWVIRGRDRLLIPVVGLLGGTGRPRSFRVEFTDWLDGQRAAIKRHDFISGEAQTRHSTRVEVENLAYPLFALYEVMPAECCGAEAPG